MRFSSPLSLACLALLAVVLVLAPAGADVVYTRTGPVEGRVVKEGPDGVTVNPHFSDHPKMTWEVVTLPRSQVVKIVRKRPAIQVYLEKAKRAAKAGEADKHVALATWCKENRLRTQMKEQAELALAADPENKAAKTILGSSAARTFLREREAYRDEILPLLEAYLATPDGDARDGIFRDLKASGFPHPEIWLQRAARSQNAPRGRHLDRKIVYRAEEFPGAVYALFVPEDYDPLRAWPLVLGLHGGGAAGKKGKEVVGSGSQALKKYRREAAARGYLLVCPSAVTAPWPNRENEQFLTALLHEIVLTYNVDLNRIYLVGHSMGGGGTWHYGPKWAETFASIAPLSAYSSGGFSALHRSSTGVYIYHGDNDDRCPVSSARTAAHALKKMGADYRYTELPGSGHACPPDIVREVFDFFDIHRLSPARKPGLFRVRTKRWGPHASFRLPPSALEKKYLAGREAGGIAGLAARLAGGGGAAEKAAKTIAEREDAAKAVPALRALLARSENEDVRRLCAWTLGAVGGEQIVPDLGAALNDPEPAVRSEAAEALAKIGGGKAVEWITRGARTMLDRFRARLEGDRRTDSVVWENEVACWIRYLGAAGAIGDAKTASALEKTVFEGVLLADIEVRYDREVQPDPARSRKRLAMASLKALERIGAPAGAEAARQLAEHMDDRPEVASEARRIAQGLSR